ncbi:ATP-binding cassette domain-containing protein [Paenibacillus rhizoplanae]
MTLSLFNGYLSLIVSPIVSIGRIITIVQGGVASLGRLNDILRVQPEILELPHAVRTQPEGSLELRNLTFYYEGSEVPALQDISLVLPKGHTLGIIGRTGSGKSTLVSLLFRFFGVKPGHILLDGRDLNDYALDSLREGLGVVPQDTFVFAASVTDNIVLFKDGYTDADVQHAAALSQIAASIEKLPDGYDTQLGERGVNLSGGQKQRLAIARALIRKPAVLILDDALSAVDAVTEGQILNSLRQTRKGKSNILISHRVSGIMEADEIIVLDKGRIAERGTHEQLLKKGGMYYDIYTGQLDEEEVCETEKKSEAGAMKLLLRLSAPYKFQLLLACLCVVIVNGAFLIQPLILQRVIDHFLIGRAAQSGLDSIGGLALLYVAVASAGGIFSYLQALIAGKSGTEPDP